MPVTIEGDIDPPSVGPVLSITSRRVPNAVPYFL